MNLSACCFYKCEITDHLNSQFTHHMEKFVMPAQVKQMATGSSTLAPGAVFSQRLDYCMEAVTRYNMDPVLMVDLLVPIFKGHWKKFLT